MKSFVLLLLSFCFLSGLGASSRAAQIDSLQELIKRYDSSSCKECHQEIYEEWQKSMHARSIFGRLGRTSATLITTIEKGLKRWPYSGVKEPEDVRIKHLMGCAKCHLPQLAQASDQVAQELVENLYAWYEDDDEEAEVRLKSLNIGCLVCHNLKAITHKWVDGPPDPKAVYGDKVGSHEDETYPLLKKSPIMGESILCGQCHGLGPNLELDNPTQCATLYGSYLFAYVAEGGHETCQDCHMRRSGKGHDIQSYRDPAMYQQAVAIEVDGLAYYWRKSKAEGVIPLGVIRVALTNRAGHAIPDG